MSLKRNVVPFVSVDHILKLILSIGVERFMLELAEFIEADLRRWNEFEKSVRLASHSHGGVIALMPTSDGESYSFKYVNGHPDNARSGRQTVTALIVQFAHSGHCALDTCQKAEPAGPIPNLRELVVRGMQLV